MPPTRPGKTKTTTTATTITTTKVDKSSSRWRQPCLMHCLAPENAHHHPPAIKMFLLYQNRLCYTATNTTTRGPRAVAPKIGQAKRGSSANHQEPVTEAARVSRAYCYLYYYRWY